MENDNIWLEVKSIPIQQLVDYPEWQRLRKLLLGTWSFNCEENTLKLHNFINQYQNKRDFAIRVRIVFNYINGTYFRINNYKLCKSIKVLREKLKDVIKNEKFSLGGKE